MAAFAYIGYAAISIAASPWARQRARGCVRASFWSPPFANTSASAAASAKMKAHNPSRSFEMNIERVIFNAAYEALAQQAPTALMILQAFSAAATIAKKHNDSQATAAGGVWTTEQIVASAFLARVMEWEPDEIDPLSAGADSILNFAAAMRVIRAAEELESTAYVAHDGMVDDSWSACHTALAAVLRWEGE
jgi:hypothetical protein